MVLLAQHPLPAVETDLNIVPSSFEELRQDVEIRFSAGLIMQLFRLCGGGYLS